MIEERIGGVKLLYDDYIGEDLYNDGNIEDTLLEIAKSVPEEELGRIVDEYADTYAMTYYFSKLRHNLLSWYDFDHEKSGLEIGAGCGALSGLLADSCKYLDCVELSKRRSLINAYRNKARNNMCIHVGNFIDFAKRTKAQYDYAFLIGVLEYSELFIQTDKPQIVFLKAIRELMRPNGKLFVAIENKLGMKYWAGCREDHLETFFSGMEGYSDGRGIRTFTRKELTEIFKAAGFTEIEFYYPHPDYKLPVMIYSDRYLPHVGELADNYGSYLSNRLKLFDEAKAFDNIIRNDLYPVFANSYLAIVS